MSQEILNSAIMQMRAKALEAYGIIKDIYRQPSQEGDADRIANLSLKLAQYEGGMLTLQQYAPEIISTVAAEIAAEKAAEEEEQAAGLEGEEAGAELPDPEELEQNAADNAPEEIVEEELTKRSATYRRSSAGRKRASRSKKKKAEDES